MIKLDKLATWFNALKRAVLINGHSEASLSRNAVILFLFFTSQLLTDINRLTSSKQFVIRLLRNDNIYDSRAQ